MLSQVVPAALRSRFGEDGTLAFLDVLTSAGDEWREDVLETATERFERRVMEETGGIRQEMSAFRLDMTRELAKIRVEWLRWSFVFWMGQVAALGGMLALLR